MNPQLRQRMLGAIVLIGLVVIAWIAMFSQSTDNVVNQQTPIPPPPAFEHYAVEEPYRPNVAPVASAPRIDPAPTDTGESIDIDSTNTDSTGEKTAVNDDEPPTQDKDGLPVTWVVQVASFSQAKNAEDLKQTLQDSGYKAYTRTSDSSNGQLTRVYVGPTVSKAQSQAIKQDIDQAFGVKSLVVRFVDS